MPRIARVLVCHFHCAEDISLYILFCLRLILSTPSSIISIHIQFRKERIATMLTDKERKGQVVYVWRERHPLTIFFLSSLTLSSLKSRSLFPSLTVTLRLAIGLFYSLISISYEQDTACPDDPSLSFNLLGCIISASTKSFTTTLRCLPTISRLNWLTDFSVECASEESWAKTDYRSI